MRRRKLKSLSHANEIAHNWQMADSNRQRRFIWLAPWFLLAGAGIVYVLMGFDSLGAALSADPNSKPSGIERFLKEVGTYCLVGAVACFTRRAKVRAMLAILAHISVVIAGALYGPKTGSFTYGMVLCGVLLIPFGFAWVILLIDLIPKRASRPPTVPPPVPAR